SENRGVAGPFILHSIDVSGLNLLGRWSRLLDNGSDVSLQAYYDHSRHEDVIFYEPDVDLIDFEFQQGIPVSIHSLMWGAGYRRSQDRVGPGYFTIFIPDSRTLDWENLFVQDEVKLGTRLTVTGGLKLERNDYTGWETLPSARFAWKPFDNHLIWGEVSRAVR